MMNSTNFRRHAYSWITKPGFPVLLLSVIYLVFFFQYAFFRHDDWWILGNAVRFISLDFLEIFKPKLVIHGVEQEWFFRPWFKLLVLTLYKCFGFHYYLWLVFNWACYVVAVFCGARTLKRFFPYHSSSLVFTVVSVCTLYIHFGSAVWVGEGVMNFPLLMILFLSSDLFLDSYISFTKSHRKILDWRYCVSLALFFLSFGFKEAAIFHFPFMIFLCLAYAGSWKKFLTNKNIQFVLPLCVISFIYLVFRLGYLPVNKGYTSVSWDWISNKTFLILILGMLLPVGLIIFCLGISNFALLKQYIRNVPTSFAFLLVALVSSLPYFGHPFFSPGWIVSPCFYSVFFSAYNLKMIPFSQSLSRLLVIVSFIFGFVPVLYQANKLDWYNWKKSQMQLHHIFTEYSNSNVSNIYISECDLPLNSEISLHRVIGSDDSIENAWWMHSKKNAEVKRLPCESFPPEFQVKDNLHIQWKYPDFIVLSGPVNN